MKLSELPLARGMAHFNFGAALAVLIWLASLSMPSLAHGARAGDLKLDHPYAVPSAPGESHGKAYLRGKDCDRFDLTLNFEHAGSQTVKVWVQTPREMQASHSAH